MLIANLSHFLILVFRCSSQTYAPYAEKPIGNQRTHTANTREDTGELDNEKEMRTREKMWLLPFGGGIAGKREEGRQI